MSTKRLRAKRELKPIWGLINIFGVFSKAASSRLWGSTGSKQTSPALIECNPHVALLAFLKFKKRLPYEVSHSGQYWNKENFSRRARTERLLDQFQTIKAGLDQHIRGTPEFMPKPSEVSTLASLKSVENRLYDLICAWIGIEHLEGRTVGLGDETDAIWVPASLQPGIPLTP